MKKELTISIILGIVALGIIGAIIIKDMPAQTSTPPTKTISMSDFSTHNTATSCWIRMNGSVYDLTNFIDQHPGGPDKILPLCGGQDATITFETKGESGSHSSAAHQKLQQFLIGTLSSQ